MPSSHRLHDCLLVLCFLCLFALLQRTGATDAASAPVFNPAESELWLLSGQSNMLGWALAKDEVTTDSRVWRTDAQGEWQIAQEPMHEHFVTTGSIALNILAQRNGLPVRPAPSIQAWLDSQQQAGIKLGGIGPSLFFGKALAEALDRPVGLIHHAHGGTRMAQWDPATTGSLFHSLVAVAGKATRHGGKIKGVLWYQGESDALTPADVETYEQNLLTFIDRLRATLGDPALPFIYVQIGRFTLHADDATQTGWEMIHELQRKAATQRPNLHMTSALDLPLDDAIHLAYEGQQRLGQRLARLALHAAYGHASGATPIELVSAQVLQPDSERPMIRVRFKGVNGRLAAPGRPLGFELRGGSNAFNQVYRVDFDPEDPHAVLLGVFHPITEPLTLWYGAGMDSPANITDSADMPLPAFGPWAIEAP